MLFQSDFGVYLMLSQILAIPAIPLTMSAGLLFGPVIGTIIVSISGTVSHFLYKCRGNGPTLSLSLSLTHTHTHNTHTHTHTQIICRLDQLLISTTNLFNSIDIFQVNVQCVFKV